MILHCFGEIDFETETPINRETYTKLFNQCEQTGFFVDQIETELIQFTGPFNVRDELDVKFFLLWNTTRKQIRDAWFEVDGDRKYIYNFISGEVAQEDLFKEIQYA